MAKDYFTENHVAFQNIDVAADAEKRKEMMDKSGQLGVPVIDIDGQIIIGFNKPKIALALGLQ
jgi:glutaredoxin